MGGHGLREEGLCHGVPASRVPSALREAKPWHYLQVQGTACLPGEPGEAERNSTAMHTWLASGCLELLWLEKNAFFQDLF